MHNERLTLATLCGGALQEKVDRALEKVAKNIVDPNTDPEKKRSITLKIILKPDEDREDVEVTADVSVSLAPELGVSTRFFVEKDLQNDCVTIMEHMKGEIRGQLDFNDIGLTSAFPDHDIQQALETRNADPETGEIIEGEEINKVVDLRRIKA